MDPGLFAFMSRLDVELSNALASTSGHVDKQTTQNIGLNAVGSMNWNSGVPGGNFLGSKNV